MTTATTACSCGRKLPNRQRTGQCSSCRSRASRQRRKSTAREDSDQNQPAAYLSDELGLSEADKAGVEQLARTPIVDPDTGAIIGTLGTASVDELLASIKRHGKIDGILQSAWALPLWQYREVEEAWRDAPAPRRPEAWRQRRRG
jgi:hypothetical protein